MDDKLYDKVCRCCGGHFVTTSRNKRMCEYCVKEKMEERRKIVHNSYKKPKAREKRFEKKVIKENRPDISLCKTCEYSTILDGSLIICDYITIIGHSRPCLPGADCACYSERIKKKKKAAQNIAFGKAVNQNEYSAYISGRMLDAERWKYNHKRK